MVALSTLSWLPRRTYMVDAVAAAAVAAAARRFFFAPPLSFFLLFFCLTETQGKPSVWEPVAVASLEGEEREEDGVGK